jgi:hypothetical protein
MTKLFAIAIPILEDKKEQFRKFTSDLKTRYKEALNESRRKLNVQERTFFQSTPKGDILIVTLEGENPQEAFLKFGEGKDEFTKWFTQQVKEIHGMDITQKTSAPLPELIVETEPVSVLVHK